MSVMPSNHLILCYPPLLPPSTFPNIRVFSNESVLRIRWPKYWSFSFNISPSNEYSGLVSFSMDWFDLLAVRGTLKSLFQCHSSKASILWPSACNPLQYSCLLNPMDGGAWWATVHGVAKSRTRLSDFTFTSLSTHLGKYQEARLLDCVVTVKKLPNCPTNYLYHFAFPLAMNKSFSCSATYQHLVLLMCWSLHSNLYV